MQTQGATGNYCALSYCWGPVDKQPIRTLGENIRDHYSGIPIAALPQTFRDAITLTKALGIDYLWIDSLCIQQDDDDDWKREAASMGALYQQATLVIAASGSKDPTGGLFICERSPKIALQLSYPNDGNEGSGAFNLAARKSPMQPLSMYRDPLQERAWALQESYLARRIAQFSLRGAGWRCKSNQCDESGSHDNLGLYEHLSWFNLLQHYSWKKLTRQSDRLVALQGIVNEEGKRKNDIFLSEGVWEKEIPQHLQWHRTSDLAPGDSALPSWSWASTEGCKKWPTRDDDLTSYSCVVIQRTQPGHLTVSGDLVQGNVEWSVMNVCCASRCELFLLRKWGAQVLGFVLGLVLGVAQAHLLQNNDGILGMAILDWNEETCIPTEHSTLEFCVLSKTTFSGMDETSGTSDFPTTGDPSSCYLDVSIPPAREQQVNRHSLT